MKIFAMIIEKQLILTVSLICLLSSCSRSKIERSIKLKGNEKIIIQMPDNETDTFKLLGYREESYSQNHDKFDRDVLIYQSDDCNGTEVEQYLCCDALTKSGESVIDVNFTIGKKGTPCFNFHGNIVIHGNDTCDLYNVRNLDNEHFQSPISSIVWSKKNGLISYIIDSVFYRVSVSP